MIIVIYLSNLSKKDKLEMLLNKTWKILNKPTTKRNYKNKYNKNKRK